MSDATFRPQDATWGYGWPSATQAALSEFVLADAIDRYPIRAANIGLTTAANRIRIRPELSIRGSLVGTIQPVQYFVGVLAEQRSRSIETRRRC